MSARLRRSRTDKMISGVCGGIAEYIGWDSTIVRLLFVIFTFFGGVTILLYFILALVMPD